MASPPKLSKAEQLALARAARLSLAVSRLLTRACLQDKTAAFVAANGPVFEARLRTAEAGNPKFAFLDPAHALHPLFRERVSAQAAVADRAHN